MITTPGTKMTPRPSSICGATPETILTDADDLQRGEHALDMMLTQRGDANAEVEQMLADNPESVFGHCLRAALIVRADSAAARSTLAASIASIESACPDRDAPARRHAIAARAWLDGDTAGAADHYHSILEDRPHDVMALVVAHALDFHLGDRRAMLNRTAKLLPKWTTEMSGYASVLAMHAFALEENGRYRLAEKTARRALALDPAHPGAIHVIAHVMEMQGRFREGLLFLTANQSAWSEGTGLSVHLAWHYALFHLEATDVNSALAIYDARIATTDSPGLSSLVDGSALLWRLKLLGTDVSTRWNQLADQWARQPLTDARPFHAVHATMALAAAGRTAAALRLIETLSRDAIHQAPSLTREQALASPLCEALLAFVNGDYAKCVRQLKQVRRIGSRCGGSVVQCDVVHLTLTEAALRARRRRLARALVTERLARNPTSWLNRFLRQRLATEPELSGKASRGRQSCGLSDGNCRKVLCGLA